MAKWCAVAIAAVATFTAVDAQPVFKTGVTGVPIRVTVVDDDGRAIEGLRAADFEVRIDDALVPIVQFQDGFTDVNLVALIDASASVWSLNLGPRAIVAALTRGLIAPDRLCVGQFDRRLGPMRCAAGVPDIEHLLTGRQDRAVGGTALWDALEDGIRFSAGESQPSATVVVTDGHDTHSRLTASAVRESAVDAGLPVCVIAHRSGPASARAQIRALALSTGGSYDEFESLRELSAIARRLVDQLRRQYLIGVDAAASADVGRVTVRLPRTRDVVVRHRTSYISGRSRGQDRF